MTEFQSLPPSKVLHIRNLPEECNEMDIRTLASPYGEVHRVLLLSRKHQAFVEYTTLEESARMLAASEATPMRLGTRTIVAQYSNKPEISAPENRGDGEGGGRGYNSYNATVPPGGDGRVLLVTVTNVVYPVSVEVMHKVFEMCGVIQKIVTFNKQGKMQALVQFERAEAAAGAIAKFEGQNIYSGCNTLSIQYSNLNDITVKYNNERSFDFTNLDLPTQNPNDALLDRNQPPGMGMGAFAGMGGRMGPGGANFGPHSPAAGRGGMGWAGDMAGPGMGYGRGGLGGMRQPGMERGYGMDNGMGRGGYGMGGGVQFGHSPVILVNNLDPERATPEALFNLFSTCGIISRIKILYNKRDSALIQFETPEHAENARLTLTGCRLWGRNLLISSSKHLTVQANRSDIEEESAKLFGDYTSSALHRYRGGAARHVPSIEPTKLLHVSNIPPHATEEDVKQLFADHGPVAKLKFITTREQTGNQDRKMALVELPSIQDAAEALAARHGTVMDGLRVRVSFSTSTLDSVR